MSLNENLKAHLVKVHQASQEHGFTYLNPKSPLVAALINSGHLLSGAADPSDAAKVGIKLSDTGLAEVAGHPAPAFPGAPVAGAEVAGAVTQEVKAKAIRGPRIVPQIVRSGARMVMPTVVRGSGLGKRTETYPFSSLEAPNHEGHDSFFVAASESNPNPAKSLAGTVSSATKRFKHEGRKFSVVSVDTDQEHGVKGARVFRVA